MLKDYYYVLDEGHLPELLKRVDVTFLNTSHCLKSYLLNLWNWCEPKYANSHEVPGYYSGCVWVGECDLKIVLHVH